MTGYTRSAAGEVVEDWTKLAKELIGRWSDYGSHVAANLDAGVYNSADKAAEDFAAGVSLTVESGFKLAWEVLDSFTIMTGGLDRPHMIDSDIFTANVPHATLTVKGPLRSHFGHRIPAAEVQVVTLTYDPETQFRLRVAVTDCEAGTYTGTVRASGPGGPSNVPVHITVP